MEDIKKIQEFFSNPVNENSRLTKQSILIEPAEIKYTESFGTGIKAPGVLHKANTGVFLGAEGAYIIVLPGGTFYVDEDTETAMPILPLKDQDQALHRALDFTPFAPKYEEWKNWIKRPKAVEEVDRYSGFNRNPEDPDSEKFEPTGSVAEFKEDLRALFGKFKGDLKNPEFIKGVAQIMVNWKSLLRSQLEEADLNDPVAMKMRAAKDKLAKMRAANAGDDGNDKFFDAAKLRALKKKRAQIMRDMEQEAELEGGEVADRYGDMLNKLDKAIAMFNLEEEEEGYSQFLKTDDNPEGKTKGLDSKTMNKILMNVIKDLNETKQLGEGVIEEELCPKGKAYIKRRKAAGEKSSAYLSGRAVKVCKGQMSGRKKKK